MNNKRILITGATGFLGFRTTEQLSQHPDVEYIVAAGRVMKQGSTVQSDNVKYLLGDLSDPAYVQTLFSHEITHIVHCAALTAPWGNYRDFYQANVLSTKNLLEKARENEIQRFVYISTPSIYFNYKDRWNVNEREKLPVRFANHYATSKRASECLLEASGLDFISLRPRALMGRGDRVIMPRIIRAAKEGKLRIIGNGENKVDVTSVGNVVQAIRLSLDAYDKALGQHYNISNGSPVVLWEIIRPTLLQLGLTFPTGKIPVSIANFVAALMETKAKLFTQREPVFTRYSVGSLALNFTMDISKAKILLGYEPTISIEDSLSEFVKWYKETIWKSSISN